MASIYKRGKCWYLNWADVSGVRHRESLGEITKPVAQAACTAKRLALLNNPTGVLPAPTLLAFSTGYLAWYRVQYPSSYDRVKSIFDSHLTPDFGPEPLNTITREKVIEWRNGRIEEAAAETVNKEIKTLKAALQRAVDWNTIPVNPLDRNSAAKGKDTLFLGKRGDRRPRFFEAHQLSLIYAKASPRNTALWKLMANTGIRRNEMLALKWENVFEDRVIVESLESRPTKGRRTRVVGLNTAGQEAAQALREIGEDATYVLRQMTLHSLSRCFRLDAKKAGVAGTIHWLRHSFCYALVRAGVHPKVIQELAGHADIKTTEIYMWASPDLRQSAVTAISL